MVVLQLSCRCLASEYVIFTTPHTALPIRHRASVARQLSSFVMSLCFPFSSCLYYPPATTSHLADYMFTHLFLYSFFSLGYPQSINCRLSGLTLIWTRVREDCQTPGSAQFLTSPGLNLPPQVLAGCEIEHHSFGNLPKMVWRQLSS